MDARRRRVRVRRRLDRAAPERLEGRELLTSTPLGYSLPDLTVSGTPAPVAAYGGPLAVSVDVRNLGASSLIEPLAIMPGMPSSADVGPTRVDVYLSPRSHFGPGAVKIGSVAVPSAPQNSFQQIEGVVNMPQTRLRRFPGSGGTVYAYFKIDTARLTQDTNRANNVTRVGVPILVAAPLPDLQATALDLPPVMQAGDAIQPWIKVANYGTVDTATQGPLVVDLVASTDTAFGPGDIVLAQFSLDSLPPLSLVPTQGIVLGDVNVDTPVNVATLQGPVVVLPQMPGVYNIGVIVDPFNSIREIREIGRGPNTNLSPVQQVGPSIPGLPPAGILVPTPPAGNVFPYPALGPIDTVGNPDPNTITDLITGPRDVLLNALSQRFFPGQTHAPGSVAARRAALQATHAHRPPRRG
ncbi:MAG: hypothetical protein ABI353_20015 [Isosphaeraceae bacterium]